MNAYLMKVRIPYCYIVRILIVRLFSSFCGQNCSDFENFPIYFRSLSITRTLKSRQQPATIFITSVEFDRIRQIIMKVSTSK